MRAPFAVTAILLLVTLLVSVPPGVRAQQVTGTINGPAALAPGQAAQYNVTISGGPGGAYVNYTLDYYISGADTTGGSPAQASPGHATGNETAFQVNVTAPQRDQTITLFVTISAGVGSTLENGTAETTIEVITPIVLTATFHNSASTAALNVTVRFYVDDSFVGTKKLARIGANADATLALNWLPIGIQPGGHKVRIEADLDSNGIIDSSRGEVVTSDLFYREGAPLGTGWTLLIAAAIFIPAFLATVALRRRRQK